MPRSTQERHFHARMLIAAIFLVITGRQIGSAQNAPPTEDYIRFLEQQFILFQSEQLAEQISGKGVQWRADYGYPEPAELVKAASVWLLYYPGSIITGPGQSVIAAEDWGLSTLAGGSLHAD